MKVRKSTLFFVCQSPCNVPAGVGSIANIERFENECFVYNTTEHYLSNSEQNT